MEKETISIVSPLYLQIPELRNLSSKRSEVLCEQQKFLEFLSDPNKFANLVISLRYVYDPTKEPNHRLKIYLSINHAEGDVQKVQSALNIITKGSLRDFYKFKSLSSQPDVMQKLENWVDVICEIIKDEKFPKNQGYYIPYLFQPNPDNDMLSVCKQLQPLDKRLIIEFTLQTCNGCDKESIKTTIKQILRGINQESSRYSGTYLSINEIDIARDIYNQYLNCYVTSDRNLFKYSIKILSESSYDIDLVVKALMQNALKDDNYGQKYQEIILKRGSEEFNKSIMATKRVELFTDVERTEWKTDFEQQLIKGVSRQNSHRQIIRLPETEPLQADNNLLPSTGELVKANDSWSSGKYFESSSDSNNISNNPSALKLLHRIVTPQQISSLFRIVVSGDIPVPGIPQELPSFNKPTAEEIFSKYKGYITEDRYIIGLDEYGNIVTSDWSAIAHRLVAGLNGSGKTNFLFWVIFQFLHANRSRQVYVLDPKKQFSLLKKAGIKIQIETEKNNYPDFLEKIYFQEFERRKELIYEEVGVENIQDLRELGFEEYRILVIVDEAAVIERMDADLRDDTERFLEEFATQGRSLGIHLIYCTQRPINLISQQVIEQLDERVIFRVSEGTSESLLGNFKAARIPQGKIGCGMAVIQHEEGNKLVSTPEIKTPKTGIPLSATLWHKLLENQ